MVSFVLVGRHKILVFFPGDFVELSSFWAHKTDLFGCSLFLRANTFI